MLRTQNSTNTAPGYTYRRISRNEPCRVCGGPDNCSRLDNAAGHNLGDYCRRPGNRGGWEWEGKDGGRFFPNPDHAGRTYDWRDVAPPVAPLPERMPADAATLDRIYRRLFDACPLSDADRSSIAARGIDPDNAERYRFGTLTSDKAERERLADIMLAGEDPGIVGHIPGIYRSDGRLTLHGSAGQLIAIVNADGLIVGARIRKPGRGGNRYQWLSTPRMLDGCGSGAPLLVAIPAGCEDFTTVGIVEGEYKAIIAAERTGRPWISVPGVTITGDVTPTLAKLGAAAVWIAYDNDAATNPQVAQAEQKLIADVIAHDFTAHRLTWPAAWKGIDDALVANIIPVAVAVSSQENAAELNRLKRIVEEERQYTAAAFAAINSRKNGPEARTAVAVVNDLKQRRIPVNEWVPYTNDRFTAVTGTSARRAADHKKLITKHYGAAIEFKVTPKGDGKDLTYVRLNAAPGEALTAIAMHDPEIAKNGNGGKREALECPTCGPDAGVEIETRFHCTSCKGVIATAPLKTYRKRREPMLDTLTTITTPDDMAPLNAVKTLDRVSSIAAAPLTPSSSPQMARFEAKWLRGASTPPAPASPALPAEPAWLSDAFRHATPAADRYTDVAHRGRA